MEDRRLQNGPACYNQVSHGYYTQNRAKTPTLMERFFEAGIDATELEVFAMAQIIIRVLKYTTTSQPLYPESQWELHKTKRLDRV